MPLTESEWRRNAIAISTNQSINKNNNKTIISSETAVNPRERPKGNLNTNNTIIPLVHSSFVGATTNNNNNNNNITSNNSNQIVIKPRNQSVAANTAHNKSMTISIKPPQAPNPPNLSNIQQQQQQPKIGFDDDFGLLNAATTPSSSTSSFSKPPMSPLQQYELNMHDLKQQQQSQQQEKRPSHRRSASQ
jgi:hypothetical protein